MNKIIDEFFIARLRLTFYYTLTAVVILGGSSIVLYKTIISNFSQSVWEEGIRDPLIFQAIIRRAQDFFISRFLVIDLVLIFFIIILGFLLTYKILEPIKSNMQRQKRFIADASHELRTPIAVVISGLEVNLENKKLDFASAKKTLESTLEEMREFSKLSNSLLDMSKYDTSVQVKHEILDINELINSVVEKNKNLAHIKNINIENKLGVKVNILGNEIELRRVFFNIFDNAIKYTNKGGTISLTDRISSGKYVVTISDTGIGIEEEIISKIFDPFFRGDSSRSTDGAGLGLTLSKKIIENHKGTISIKSQINKGTSVTVSLPVTS